MGTWGFRFRFLLPRDKRINEESDSFEIYLPSEDKTIILKAHERDSIREAENLVISGKGFRLREEAERCGNRVKNSILLCGPILRTGFDIGKDKASFIIGNYLKEKGKELGFNIIEDTHGLCIFEEELKVTVFSSKSSVIIGTPLKLLIDKFNHIYGIDINLSNKETLALELYNMSFFESSLRARFVTLISAIEALCKRFKRSNEAIKYLDNLIDITSNSNLFEIDKKSIINNINNIRTESISESCRQLVKKNLGIDKEAEFIKYYKIRNQISHNGAPHRGINLGTEILGLEGLVSNLLESLIIGDRIASNTGSKYERHIIKRHFIE
jgi:hypothetical protein